MTEVTLNGGQESSILVGGTDNDTLLGSSGNDIVTDLGGDNFLFGDAGDDILTGAGGNDTIRGGPGNDIVVGLGGNNSLFGSMGDDTLTGGGIAFVNNALLVTADTTGIDTLTGEEGADRFVLGGDPGPEPGSTAPPVIHYDSAGNSDYAVITDFDSSQDVIQLGGSKNDYRLGSSLSGLPTGTAIYLQDELIAIVQGSSDLSLSASYFQGSVG
jgi:Ca2+-binding RTX toxin-like protein